MQEDTEHFFFFSCIAAERHTVTSALGSCFQSTCWFTWCEMKQMFNFAGPTHESMDFCYLSVMFCCMFELFWKIYLMKNQKTSKKSWNSTEKNWNLTNSVVILSSWAGVLSVLFWMQLLLCSYCEKERWNDSIKKMCDILMSSCCSVSRPAFLNFPHLGFFFIFFFIFKISVSFYYASQKSVVLTSSRAFVRPFYINVFLSLCVCVLQSWSRW